MDSSDGRVMQLLNGLVTQLSKADGLSDGFCKHACSALLTVQQPVRACEVQQQGLQPSKLSETFQKFLSALVTRASKGSPLSHEQSLALQLLAACIRVCDAVTLLQQAVAWGSLLAEVLRRAAAPAATAAAAPEGMANGINPAAAAPAVSAPAAATVIQAACAAAGELFSRLQQYIELPAVRREVSSIAPKLLQPLLAVLQRSSTPDAAQAAALQLLASLLRCVPSSLRPSLTTVERALRQLVVVAAAATAGSSVSSAGGPLKQQLLAQAALCAALLPAVAGDAAAWSDAARQLLVSCHDVLDQLLMGLEGRPVQPQYRHDLATAPMQQQGQQHMAAGGSGGWLPSLPWQQQQQQPQQQQQQAGAVQRRQTVPALLLASFCLSALQQLLQQPFSVAVPVPGLSLALLAARLHRFDAAAAVAAGAVPGSSTMYQELLVLQPQLQLAGWQLLAQVVTRCGQQLQLQGLLLRLVRQGLRAVQLSGPAALVQQHVSVRCSMYEAAVLLLQATGMAGARAIAAEAMGCVVLELYGTQAAAAAAGAAGGQSSGAQQRPSKRARKSGGAAGGELGQFDPAAAVAAAAAAAGDEGSRAAAADPADLQAQASVLALLRGLLAAGGQLLPAGVRAHADAIAFHISSSAAQLVVQLGPQPGLSTAAAGRGGALAALQVAAYEALLTSVLVPCGHRPPFLSQAVALFRQGRSSSNAAVAAACQSAAVQVEVLLHPCATAMGGVRQYAGMESVPALPRPRMWDVFEQQQAPAVRAAGNAAAGAATTAVAAAGSAPACMQPAVQGAGQQLSSIPAAAANHLPAGMEAVVMGYPVVGQVANSNLKGQQAPTQQQQLPGGLQQPAPVPSQQGLLQAPNAALQADEVPSTMQPGGPVGMEVNIEQPQLGASVQQQQQEQEQVLTNAPAATGILAAGLTEPSLAPVQPAHAAAAAPAAPVFAHDESSDSEGPLPDIDSGSSTSSSSEGEDE